MEPETFVALRPCGCIVMAVVDTPDQKQLVAREVAKAIRQGYEVRKVATAWVRTEGRFRCANSGHVASR